MDMILDVPGRLLLALRLAGLEADAGMPPSEAALFAACASFCSLEAEKLALYHGPSSIADDDAREEALTPLYDRQLPLVDQICDCRAGTLPGHRARAGVYFLSNAGELAWRSLAGGSAEDRLLAALIHDLVDGL